MASKFDGMIVTRPRALVYRLEDAAVNADSVLATLQNTSPRLAAFTRNLGDHPLR